MDDDNTAHGRLGRGTVWLFWIIVGIVCLHQSLHAAVEWWQ